MTEMIDTPKLKILIEAGSVHHLSVRGIPGGWVLVAKVGSGERILHAQRGQVRVFRTLDGVAGFSRECGVRKLDVDMAGYSTESLL